MTDLFATPCTACDAAAADRLSGLYRKGCNRCSARQLARGPDFHRCRTLGKQDRAYRDLLEAHGVTHSEVVAAAEASRERAAA